MSDDKILQFRPRARPAEKEVGISDPFSLSKIIGSLNEKMGLEDIPAQQALRIVLGLNGLEDYKPSAELVVEGNKVLSNWSPEEILNEAKKSTVLDWKMKPAFYTALVIALRAKK